MSNRKSHVLNVDQLAEMFNLTSWDTFRELNIEYIYDCGSSFKKNLNENEDATEDELDQADMDGQQEAETGLYHSWHAGVMNAAEMLFGFHKLELTPVKVRRKNVKVPYEYTVKPTNDWKVAADSIRETVNGVGDFHFNTLNEFLSSGPYTARQAVISHLNYIRRMPDVYGSMSARQHFDNCVR